MEVQSLIILDPINVWSKVYFIQEKDKRIIKIGHADDVYSRIKELQTGNSDELELLHWTTGGRALESYLHEKFEGLKKRGEWFYPDNKLLDLIEEYKYEDNRFGRVASIVQFVESKGMLLDENEREILVLLTRGGYLQVEDEEDKARYWSILQSYRQYLETFPLKMCRNRRMECRISSLNRPVEKFHASE